MTKPKPQPPLNVPNAVRTNADGRRNRKVQGLLSKKESGLRGLNFPVAGGNPDPAWLAQRRMVQDAVTGIEAETKRLESLTGDELVRAMCPEWVAVRKRGHSLSLSLLRRAGRWNVTVRQGKGSRKTAWYPDRLCPGH